MPLAGRNMRKAAFTSEWTRGGVWVVRVGGDDGELRPWHYIYVYSIESRLIMRPKRGGANETVPLDGRMKSDSVESGSI